MKASKLVAVLTTVLALTFTVKAAEFTPESPRYNVSAFWILGPVRTNLVSDTAYDPFAEAMVAKLYNNRTLADVDVGHRLLTEHVTQPAERNGNSLHLAVRIVGVNGAKVSLSMLRGVMASSDNAGTLNNSYSLSSVQNLVYSPKAWGVNHTGGERASDSIDKSGSGSALKDEIVFIGMQCKYYPFSSSEGYDQIHTYISGYNPAFTLTGTWEVVNGEGAILGSGSRTLRYGEDTPMAPTLSISDSDPNVTVGINMEVGRTANLYESESVTGGWVLKCTLNPGDTLDVTKESDGRRFYKATLQPHGP